MSDAKENLEHVRRILLDSDIPQLRAERDEARESTRAWVECARKMVLDMGNDIEQLRVERDEARGVAEAMRRENGEDGGDYPLPWEIDSEDYE